MTIRSLAPFAILFLIGFAGWANAGALPAPECSTDFAGASALFQKVLGEDAPIGRIPEFEGAFKTGLGPLQTKNKIIQSGDQVFLNTRLVLLNTDISSPVRICRDGSKLKATLIMSGAMMKNKLGSKPVQSNFKDVPNEIVINISRPAGSNNVVFKTETFGDEPERSVTLK